MAKSSKELQDDYNKSAALTGKQNDQRNVYGTNTPNQNYKSPGNGGGGSGNTCFPKGTMIDTPNGQMDISLIEEGDYVKTFDLKSKSFKNVKVLKKINSHLSKNLLELSFDNHTKIRTTAKHSLRIANKKWSMAKNIKSGDVIYFLDQRVFSQAVKVTSVKRVSKETEVYNLISDYNFNFIADGMLVHSFSYFRKYQSLWWSFKQLINSRGMNRSEELITTSRS